MATLPIKSASVPTLRRLAGYYHILKPLEGTLLQHVSCTYIATEMNTDPTQVRKDIEATGLVGKPKVGYSLRELVRSIETFLGWNRRSEAFLVGGGHLGMALLGYARFAEYGLDIVAVFDTDPSKISKTLQGRHVLPTAKLASLAKRMHISVGIITVPSEAAQAVADAMVAGGIRAIWNFAPVRLVVPDFIIVENVSLASSLAVLTNRLARAVDPATKENAPHD